MLTSLRIQNFKSWADTGPVRLAPLTVIFGGNSAGKSSLGHLLLALKQTVLSTDRKRALNLGDPNTLIDLGTFEDCLHGHDLQSKLVFELGWVLPNGLEVRDALRPADRYTGTSMTFEATIAADVRKQPRTERFRYVLCASGEPSLSAEVSASKSSLNLEATPLVLAREVGRPNVSAEPEKFYRLPEAFLAGFKNAGFLVDFALATENVLRSVAYLGPLREAPRRTYQWSGDTPEDVGQLGQNAVAALLAAESEDRRLNFAPRRDRRRFSEIIAGQLKTLGIIQQFTVRPIADGRKEFEVLVRTGTDGAEVKITDVGVGVSQVLPALVQAFYCPANSTVWMEQPEIHLHPQVQAELADVFISAIHAREGGAPRNVQLVIESHSEHFLNRLQRRIAEETLRADEVAIYFASRRNGGTSLEPLRLNKYGDIENWPSNFFGDDMADLTARTVAAARRRKQATQA